MIASIPTDIAELDAFLTRVGFDLIEELQNCLTRWKSLPDYKSLADAHLVLLLHLPKRRSPNDLVETTERIAFLCGRPLSHIDNQLSNFRMAQQHAGVILIPDEVRDRANLPLLPFEVTSQFSPNLAAALNGSSEESRNFCLLGAGAVGSQVLDTLVRSGFGRWTIVDEDRLLPHNLARHQLTGSFLGHRKASASAQLANDLFTEDIATSIVADLLDHTKNNTEIKNALQSSVAVLDCTASLPVARRLAAGELASARAISLFLNPSGDALVLLAEDIERTCRLDWLEMQYYRAIASDARLESHLRSPAMTRYSNACRSVTSRVPQESVALFAAIGSRAFRRSIASPNGGIGVWQLTSSIAVERIDIVPETVLVSKTGQWTICADQYVLRALVAARASRLPKETGGVLVGGYDTHRLIIYVVDMLPSPPDSEEWPSSYRRGSQGLRKRLREISDRTLQNLDYVGEWHSHPDSCSISPSSLDDAALRALSEEMGTVGLPGLMMIVGDATKYAFYLMDGA